jgi:hypothetical protein
MKQFFKVTLASFITWVAAVISHNAIFDWSYFPWEGRDAEQFVAACLFPPALCLIAFFLFRWAFGEDFIKWLKGIRPNITAIVMIFFAIVAAVNAGEAASEASNAASESSNAASEASEAKSEANNAASDAASAASSCRSLLYK